MRFAVTGSAIDAAAWRAELDDPRCGAYAAFEGWVRDHHDGRQVLGLHYD